MSKNRPRFEVSANDGPVNGNHLSNDGAFIEKRRRGLARFLNALVRHPILSQEQMVIMFMTVPTVSVRASTVPFVWR